MDVRVFARSAEYFCSECCVSEKRRYICFSSNDTCRCLGSAYFYELVKEHDNGAESWQIANGFDLCVQLWLDFCGGGSV